jgi:hypothetical protein
MNESLPAPGPALRWSVEQRFSFAARRLYWDGNLSWTFRIFYRRAGYPAAQKMSSEAMKCSASSMGRMVRPNGPALVQRSFHSDQ